MVYNTGLYLQLSFKSSIVFQIFEPTIEKSPIYPIFKNGNTKGYKLTLSPFPPLSHDTFSSKYPAF